MSEELLQRDLIKNPEKIGKWDFYNIGSTSIKALKGYGIIRNIDYGKLENKKVDALIVFKKQVIAIIEYKTPSQFRTKEQKEKAISQEIEVAQKLDSKILIATDTKESVWVNTKTGKRIKDESGNEIKILFGSKNDKIIQLIEKINYSINELNDNIKPLKLVNPTDLAKQIWQDIWSVSGATPENCLYTFVELFIFKYLSDLGVLEEDVNFEHLMSRFNYKTDKPNEKALEFYANTIRPRIKILFPANEQGDKTTIINGTIFVSKDQKAVEGYSTVFKKVLEKFRDYGKLENIDYDFKSKLFESFLKESISKKNWGQFFTPLKVVRAIVEMAKDDIKEGISICDPACGVGKFLLEPIITHLNDFFKIENNKIIQKITIHGFDKGFDKDEQKTIILAKANMLIYFSDLIKENPALTNDFAKIFNESFILKTNSILGTLSEPIENKYDLILTNPPYVTSGSSNLKEEISKVGELKNYYKINAIGVEGLFMEWIIRALKPGGKAFVIIPDGILNRQSDKYLRKFILDECFLDGLISLPIKTFFTTPKKTYILCITKKINKSDIQETPVFTYLVSEIGESRDIYRFDIEQRDLQEEVILFNMFKGAKKHFKTDDKRCKIQPIEKFIPDNHWSIDRWWTEQEKIDLGIIEETKKISLNDLSDFVGELANSLLECQNVIKELSEKKKYVNDYKKLLLKDKEYFELFIGKRIVKRNFVNINGNIPIYSANVTKPVTFLNQSNISNFDNNFVLWGIDGDFEFNIKKRNEIFGTTDHCGCVRIKTDNILPIYLVYQLYKVKNSYGFDRSLRSSLKNMAEIEIKIPIDEKEDFDIEKQNEIVEKYQTIEEIKSIIADYEERINQIALEIDYSLTKNINISQIFDLGIKTNNSKFTKTFIENNKGNIPVYSASKFSDKPDYGYVKDNLKGIKYFENCLTWNIDGSIGNVFIREGRFSLSEKVIPLIFEGNNKEIFDKEYLKYIIENQFGKLSFGFSNKAGKSKIKDIEIPIPINEQGEFDLQAQKDIAEKYRKIDEIKSSIIYELDKIQNIDIDIE